MLAGGLFGVRMDHGFPTKGTSVCQLPPPNPPLIYRRQDSSRLAKLALTGLSPPRLSTGRDSVSRDQASK